jgi:hypothetical protein
MTGKSAEQFAEEIRQRLNEIETERARLTLALDALAPKPADRWAAARAAKAAKREGTTHG